MKGLNTMTYLRSINLILFAVIALGSLRPTTSIADALDERYFEDAVTSLHRFSDFSKLSKSHIDYISALPDSFYYQFGDASNSSLKKPNLNLPVVEKTKYGIQIIGKGEALVLEPSHKFGALLVNKKTIFWDSKLNIANNIKNFVEKVSLRDQTNLNINLFKFMIYNPVAYAKVRYDHDEKLPDLPEYFVNLARDDRVAIGAVAYPIVAPPVIGAGLTIYDMVARLWRPSYWPLLKELKMGVQVTAQTSAEFMAKFSGPLTLAMGLFYANNAMPTVKCGENGSFEMRHGNASFDDRWDKALQLQKTYLSYEATGNSKFKLNFNSEQAGKEFPLFDNDSIKKFFKSYMENLGFKVKDDDPRLEHYANLISREFKTISNKCMRQAGNSFEWHLTSLQKIEARLQTKKTLLKTGPCANPNDTFEGKPCSPSAPSAPKQ